MVSVFAKSQIWYASPLGVMLAEQQEKLIEPVLANVFGYYIIQIYGDQNYLTSARIKNKFVIEADSGVRFNQSLLAQADVLPIQADSVDAVVLPHTLEISAHPHHVLREVERVLIPEGRVIIMGFNPWGLVGLRRLVSWRSQSFPWCANFYGLSRVADWLSLLGFEVISIERYFFVVPVQRHAVVSQSKWMDPVGHRVWPFFSGAYMLVAKKRVSTMTPIRPRWGPRLVANGVREVRMRRGP